MKTRSYQFDQALIDGQWESDPIVEVADDGSIVSVGTGNPGGNDQAKILEKIPGVALPGIPNLHSHAFQRGLAGLSEFRSAKHDSFWSWRNQMYQFLEKLNPDEVYSIAYRLYRELLSSGYTAVGEFHYVHNDPHGIRYPHLPEMASAVIKAALDAGIRICFIPALYQQGGFGESLQPNQRRFFLETETMWELIQRVSSEFGSHPLFQIGMALHSLRAVEVRAGQTIVAEYNKHYPRNPIHIHIAEQKAEVHQCLAATGQRPIAFLFDHFQVDSRWCLVHATHAHANEIELMADSRCVVGLCPTTEANLGDGIFPAEKFLHQGGRFGIGSDSQISIFWVSELRMLEYGQRLMHRRRAILSTEQYSTGRTLFEQAATGGAQALGLAAGRIASGHLADLIVIDPQHPAIGNVRGDLLLDRLIFCDQGNPIQDVMVNGRWTSQSVANGRYQF